MFESWQLFARWSRLRRRVMRRTRSAVRRWPAGPPPLRAELLSAEQMEAHGRALSKQHRLMAEAGPELLLGRLRENQSILDDASESLTAMVRDGMQISPAGEWLLDNYYLIEEQVRLARRHLPRDYSRDLPVLAEGPSGGLPRVYDLAMQAIAHGDGRVDSETLSRLVAAYQEHTPLKLGELWAVPIMLRLAVIENLRRIAVRVIRDASHHRLATEWSQRLAQTADMAPKDVVLVLADMARADPPPSSAFVAEFVRRLQGRGAALAMPLEWMRQWLAGEGRNIEAMVRGEGRKQAADQVSIRNSIASLRFLSAMDWREYVETMSVVEQALRRDPDGTYARMDFTTRDHYRHCVERIARRAGVEEHQVASAVLSLAEAHARTVEGEMPHGRVPDVTAHVGWWLVGDGVDALHDAVAALPGARRPHAWWPRRVPLGLYLAPAALIAALFTAWLLHGTAWPASPWLSVFAAALSLLAASEMAIALVNWSATLLVSPRPLPRLDFSAGIPADARTVVVVPTMIGSVAGIDALARGLEVRYLANRDPQLSYVLLTDFLDADSETLPTDAALLAHATACVDMLNARYREEGVDGDRFFLLHRPRLWNPREGVWMAHERKRGKLGALSALLREGDEAAFSHMVGDVSGLRHARYVITLDTDTLLPRGAACELVGAMSHPLNRPVFDPGKGRVVRGYGILQPGVGSTMSGRRGSRFARLFGTETGIDPYTRTVSDVYQDVFGEGSFVGKGIFDVEAFERAIGGCFPDNAILSHDLIEGCHARAGLISDLRLYEDYPARYLVDMRRRARWVRGDWQLLPWLMPRVPLPGGAYARNPMSWLSRGKLVDNLRRSLVAPAALALFAAGWWWLDDPLRWTLGLLALWAIPVVVPAVREVFARPIDMAPEPYLLHIARGLGRSLQRAAVTLACLPYESGVHLTAIGRTLWRMAVSRRHLLQWNPSHEVERGLRRRGSEEIGEMLPASLASAGFAVALGAHDLHALLVAAPLLALWSAAPPLMAWLGRPRPESRDELGAEDGAWLGVLARRTWAFFETWMGEDDHWLPPDNIQETGGDVVAHRTSPTNIGLALLANLGAWDFGYLQAGGVVARTRATLATMARLERHRGHFYNWYDTTTLDPLPPRYVSTVDSGNLAGHLLVLQQGLRALIDAPVLSPHTADGMADTLAAIEDTARDAARGADLSASITRVRQGIEHLRTSPAASGQALQALQACAGQLATAWVQAGLDPAVPCAPAALQRACDEALAEWRMFAGTAPQGSEAPEGAPTLRALADSQDAAVREAARARIGELEDLAERAGAFAQMDAGFLYDRAQKLLSIGFNVDERRLDAARYDLLASEARLGHFVAIAQGQLPQESWFALGRLLTEVDGEATLLSWSGSMFEYLMPHLVMPAYPDTLLEQTMRHSVQAQIHYGRQRDVPWGISESGYAAVDAQRNWQYRAFGVPGLGLKRGLGDDLVIAPYATAMALMAAPGAATRNLRRLQALGFGGRFGLYEAIDYTPERQPPGHDYTLIRQWMAHHQGMSFLAMVSLLRGEPMQRRFVADPSVQATLLLLQERIPRIGTFHPHEADFTGTPALLAGDDTPRLRVFQDPAPSRPAVQLLSNGRYHAMVTAAGGGYSRRGAIAVTRWRDDATRDAWGQFCYLRDVESGEVWSTAFQPACVPVRGYEAIFSDAKAEFRGRHRGFDHHLVIAVSSEDDVELRRLTLTNRTRRARTVEFTTYAEVVLSPQAADEAHPAFGNLFVRTAILRDKQAISCTRRPRASGEAPPDMVHLVTVHDADIDQISYETDRARFVGRTRNLRDPAAMDHDRLSDTEGAVLDPVVAIRCRITLAPDQVASIDIVTGVSDDAGGCTALVEKYRDRRLADRVFDLAWTHSQVSNRQINATAADTRVYERMAGLVVQGSPLLRADASIVLQNRRGQSGLWGQAISGDLPIVLVQVTDEEQLPLVRQMVQAHAYLRMRGLATDLVVWNDSQTGYRQQLQEQILGLLSRDPASARLDAPGGIFVRTAQQMTQEERVLLQSVARVIVHGEEGALASQIARVLPPERDPPAWEASSADAPEASASMVPGAPEAGLPPPMDPAEHPSPFEPPSEALQFYNGTGGFSRDGREYVIVSRPGAPTPAPWSNVLANAAFGCVVSESAAGYSWHGNAHAFRLTPWHNDPVSDACGEAYYLRDEVTGAVWSPMPLPRRGTGAYRTRHGFGYTVYEHVEEGIASELWVFVDPVEPVKYAVLKLRNLSGRERRLSATGYVEWVLGDLASKTRMHVVTGVDLATGLLTARNAYNADFGARCAFFDVDAAPDPDDGSLRREFTADRVEFLGRNGHAADPAALRRRGFSGRTGVGLDPCAALQVPVTLAAGERFETTFRLGSADDENAAIALAMRLRAAGIAHDALDVIRAHWDDVLGRVVVETPDPAMDVLANGWLMYQVLSSRCLGRSGYYQSGGAFGFRDQLQDTMASIHAQPALSRTHLLASAAQQFPEGDVLHWWHPPSNRGVRTRCSDDYLWLPQAAARYVTVTGDREVLHEQVPFIEGRPVQPDEESYYDLPTVSGRRDTLYEHCRLALQRGARLLGARGLPLFGTGDWNDGMNKVGEHGIGESVWLAFFLIDALQRFAPVAEGEGDATFAGWCRARAVALRDAVEAHAWDGAWYCRGWFDDGSPLGSQVNDECRIDSISQSWAVLSGAGAEGRTRQAMESLDAQLVRRDAGLIQLLDPPFDRIEKDPGYIRGYVPGVRENGGQYTHAAVWSIMAYARMGDAARAWELAAMINPVRHARDGEAVARYRVEPYVIAADVYAVAPHDGRGGWTWYTGSAGWMYRLVLESLLGFDRQGDRLQLAPCVPRDWEGYRIVYRSGSSTYRIAVRQHDGERACLQVDGVVQPATSFALVDDGAVHDVLLDWPRARGTGPGRRTARLSSLSKLRALERWVDEATSVHMRPYVLKGSFDRDAGAIVRAAADDHVLLARIEPRLARLRARLEPSGESVD
jgi:cellobiose phosphorylase